MVCAGLAIWLCVFEAVWGFVVCAGLAVWLCVFEAVWEIVVCAGLAIWLCVFEAVWGFVVCAGLAVWLCVFEAVWEIVGARWAGCMASVFLFIFHHSPPMKIYYFSEHQYHKRIKPFLARRKPGNKK